MFFCFLFWVFFFVGGGGGGGEGVNKINKCLVILVE